MKSQNKYEEFSFSINSIESGWLKARIVAKNTSLDFTVSYLCKPLSNLLEVDAYNDGRYSFASGLKSEFHLVWQGEPWRYNWLFEPQQDRRVAITIYYCEDYLGSKNAAEHVKLRIVVALDDLLRKVLMEAERILRRYGFLGYKNEWIQSDFPIGNLLRLRSILNKDGLQETSLSKEVEYFSELLRL
ncbi:MAG: hypothetical protein HUU08_09490 [Candidatus Brocadia sp.]|nr:hypothetical protein [Candidatus Brocadia sp.]UJS17492.1 MAG: hypothetical protein L3J17_00125 [Candidatus Jettenia sp.]